MAGRDWRTLGRLPRYMRWRRSRSASPDSRAGCSAFDFYCHLVFFDPTRTRYIRFHNVTCLHLLSGTRSPVDEISTPCIVVYLGHILGLLSGFTSLADPTRCTKRVCINHV